MSAGLTAFLNARLDEDEALIRRNSDHHGLADGFPDYRTYDGPDQNAADEYIEHFGPARAFREVEAKRAILDEHFILTNENRVEAYEEYSVVPWGAKGGAGDQGSGCVTCHYYGMGGVKGYGICRTVRILAAVYSDHPDYRQEWGESPSVIVVAP